MIMNEAFFAFVAALAYLVSPAALIWGWIRYVRERPRAWTFFSILSFSGFVLASLSALYGLWVILYASANGFGTVSLKNYSPDYESFYRCVRTGAAVSLVALLLAASGVWRRGPSVGSRSSVRLEHSHFGSSPQHGHDGVG